MTSSRFSRVVAPLLAAAVCIAAGADAAGAVNYGPISHKGLKKAGGASTSLKLPLQIGLVANNSGIQSAAKKASNPKSDSYGKYPSLSTLAEQVGRDVVGAQRSQERVQVSGGDGQDRRDPSARVGDGVDRQGAEDVRDEVGRLPHLDGESARRAAGEHPEAAEGVEGERRRRCRHAPDRQPRVVVRARGSAAQEGPRFFGRGSVRRWHAHPDGDRGPVVPPHDAAKRAGLLRGPVPEPDPQRIRDRAVAGGRAARTGRASSRSSARRPRRPRTSISSATASGRRERR